MQYYVFYPFPFLCCHWGWWEMKVGSFDKPAEATLWLNTLLYVTMVKVHGSPLAVFEPTTYIIIWHALAQKWYVLYRSVFTHKQIWALSLMMLSEPWTSPQQEGGERHPSSYCDTWRRHVHLPLGCPLPPFIHIHKGIRVWRSFILHHSGLLAFYSLGPFKNVTYKCKCWTLYICRHEGNVLSASHFSC